MPVICLCCMQCSKFPGKTRCLTPFFLGNKVAARSMQLAGYCHQHPKLAAQKGRPHGRKSQGRTGPEMTDKLSALKKDELNGASTPGPCLRAP